MVKEAPFSGRRFVRAKIFTVSADRAVVAVLVILMVTLCVAYSNHFHNDFQFDDAHTIQNNTAIRQLGNIPKFFVDGTTFSALPSNQSYRPLVSTLLAISYWAGGGLEPFWFHVFIFGLFLCQVLALGYALYRLLEEFAPSRNNVLIASSAVALYALHPANADTINYIIACSDVISTLGIVGAFACYLGFPRARGYYVYVLPAAVATLAKPPAAIFALLFLVYHLLLAAPAPLQGWWPRVRQVTPVILICSTAVWFVSYMTPAHWAGGASSTGRYIATQPYVSLLYFQTFLCPTSLSADYDLSAFTSLNDPRFVTGVGFLLLFVALAVTCSARKETRLIAFGMWWFLICLLPTSLTPLAEVMNDHRTFLPYVGLAISVAGAASVLIRTRWLTALRVRRGVIALVVLLLATNAWGAYQRNKVWRTPRSLWRDVVDKGPENPRGLMNYGLALMSERDYPEALRYFKQAQAIAPRYAILLVNVAIAEGATGDDEAAERDFATALQLAPTNPDTHAYYARWLLDRSRSLQALAEASKALELAPGNAMARDLALIAKTEMSRPRTPEYYLTLSRDHYRAKRYAASIAAAHAALSLRPSYSEAWNNIGAAYNAMARFDEGARACTESLRLNPDNKFAQNNLQFALKHQARP